MITLSACCHSYKDTVGLESLKSALNIELRQGMTREHTEKILIHHGIEPYFHATENTIRAVYKDPKQGVVYESLVLELSGKPDTHGNWKLLSIVIRTVYTGP